MNYYIREDFESPMQGPFTPAEIIRQLNEGHVTVKWLATGDLREPRPVVERSPRRDWESISSIRGLNPHWVDERMRSDENSREQKAVSDGCLRGVFITLAVVFALLAVVFGVIYAGCHGQRIN